MPTPNNRSGNLAYDVRVRRLCTGGDFILRLFAKDESAACERAKESARFAIGMRRTELQRLEASGIAVFRIVASAVSANQSRPVTA
ncbi:MAG: hypothetical protein ACXWNL_16165 [Vulcanimicrobiaceae bacterium]